MEKNPKPLELTRFLKITSAAAYMDVCPRTIRRLVAEGVLRFVVFPHNIKRIDREQIDALGRREETGMPGLVTAEEEQRFVRGRTQGGR